MAGRGTLASLIVLAAHSTLIRVDGRPGVAAVMHDRVVSIMAFEIDDDRIVGLEVLADPTRLGCLGVHTTVDTSAK